MESWLAPPSHEPDERIFVEAAKRDPSRFAELNERNFDRVYVYVSLQFRAIQSLRVRLQESRQKKSGEANA